MSHLAILLKSSLLLVGLLLGAPQAFADNKVCVLTFERRTHPIAKGVMKIFKDAIDTKVVIEATPKDLFQCLEDDFEEILFISHALEMDQTRKNVNLGYFVEKKGQERSDFIEQMKTALEAELEKNPKRKYRKLLRKYENLPPEFPVYGAPMLMLSRAMEKAEAIIARKFQAGELKLKKFRSMTCFRDEIRERYAFYDNLEKYNVQMEQAPKSKILSFLSKKSVSNFRVGWVKRSLIKKGPDESGPSEDY